MVDQEEEDLQMALRMSLQPSPPSPPDAKRSKPPRENAGLPSASGSPEESPDARDRRIQREIRAAAAEKRMMMAKSTALPKKEKSPMVAATQSVETAAGPAEERKVMNLGEELSIADANQLFSMLFGSDVSRDILLQWSNQGIR